MMKPVFLENMIATVDNATVVILINVDKPVLRHNATVGKIAGLQQDHHLVPQDAQEMLLSATGHVNVTLDT